MPAARTSESQSPKPKSKLRHRWNHRSAVHRRVVTSANAALRQIPNGALYDGLMVRRRHVLPYSLVGPADVVIQVGAPFDTLMSGRSRGLSLAMMASSGLAVLVEPSSASVKELRKVGADLGLPSLQVHHGALFSEPQSAIILYEDLKHPARNFIEGMVDYAPEDLADFNRVEVPAYTLDQVWQDQCASRKVRLLSITTNGAEAAILAGGAETLANTDYLALAITSDDVMDIADGVGFSPVGSDDRGFTFFRR